MLNEDNCLNIFFLNLKYFKREGNVEICIWITGGWQINEKDLGIIYIYFFNPHKNGPFGAPM
jgi:hypothetical protein